MTDEQPTRKKVSRERQLKINEASRKCRKRQKQELAFLRQHAAHLEEIIDQHRLVCDSFRVSYQLKSENERIKPEDSNISLKQKQELLVIGSFIRRTLSLESKGFSPDVVSIMPIQMGGWDVRLSITEKNFSFHSQKFFPCQYMDVFQFCWENNLKQQTNNKNQQYCYISELDHHTAYVSAKTQGQWSLMVHGVPNVAYKSILCRSKELDRAVICQQSHLQDSDFTDPDTIPWNFRRWVVFRPKIHDGISGTLVESYRTACYATGKPLYSETAQYDRFCEHIIRRYSESNAMLEHMMGQDGRFQNIQPTCLSIAETDRFVTNFLLF